MVCLMEVGRFYQLVFKVLKNKSIELAEVIVSTRGVNKARQIIASKFQSSKLPFLLLERGVHDGEGWTEAGHSAIEKLAFHLSEV